MNLINMGVHCLGPKWKLVVPMVVGMECKRHGGVIIGLEQYHGRSLHGRLTLKC